MNRGNADPPKLSELMNLVREFPDRAAKWLFQVPENLHDLLRIMHVDFEAKLDFAAMKSLNVSQILTDFRERRSDGLFEIPFRFGGDGHPAEKTPTEVLIYLLMEHQSTPDPEMGVRVHCLTGRIWNQERLVWESKKIPAEERRLTPIVPILFYTGDESWEAPVSVATLMDLPSELEPFMPSHETLFLNLKERPSESLTEENSPLGWALRVWQQEGAPGEAYLDTLREAAAHLHRALPESSQRLDNLLYMTFGYPANSCILMAYVV